VLPAADSLNDNDILFFSGLSFFSIWGVFLFILLPSTKKIFGIISLSIALVGAGIQLNQLRIKSSRPATVEKLFLLNVLEKDPINAFVLVRQTQSYLLNSKGLVEKELSTTDVYRTIPVSVLQKLSTEKYFYMVFLDVVKPLVYIQNDKLIW
jgi:hypothetical protein